VQQVMVIRRRAMKDSRAARPTVALFRVPAAQPAVKVKPPAAVAAFVLVGVPWLGVPKGSWGCTRGIRF